MFEIENQFRLWILGWTKLLDGILQIVTFGFFSPSITLKAAKSYARWLTRKAKDV